LTVTMFGGIGSIWGPVIGAAILIPTGEILQAQLGARFPGIEGVIYGLAIVIVILVAPEGIYWKVRDLWRRRTASPVPMPTSALTTDNHESTLAVSNTPRAMPREPGKVILTVRNLSKSFGGLKAVQDVSFDVTQGSILGIIGPNGAGKTTLFNLLNGFQKPDSGEVLLDGENVIGLKPHQLCDAGVGRTFQIMRPFPRLSVADNVVIGAYVHSGNDDDARRLAHDAIARVGLLDIADRIAGGLTTKQLRLMELARALAGQPRILLLDETLAGLGSAEAAEVVAVLQTLAKDGITIVIIEHTMHTMVRLVDRFLVLDHGAVLVEDAPEVVTKDVRVIEAYLGKKWMAHA
jgi:ABC-type branched-subunit amino acid transport system ATPase component